MYILVYKVLQDFHHQHYDMRHWQGRPNSKPPKVPQVEAARIAMKGVAMFHVVLTLLKTIMPMMLIAMLVMAMRKRQGYLDAIECLECF